MRVEISDDTAARLLGIAEKGRGYLKYYPEDYQAIVKLAEAMPSYRSHTFEQCPECEMDTYQKASTIRHDGSGLMECFECGKLVVKQAGYFPEEVRP